MTTANDIVEEPPFHEILTPRLRLRTLRVSDAEALMPILTREDVMKWTSHGVVSNVAQAERWTSDRALGKDVFNFAIELRDAPAHASSKKDIIGLVGSFHLPQTGYMIHPDHAGKGYATEAFAAVIPQLFDRIPRLSEGGTDHVEGWTDVNNWPSRTILAKCGFELCEIIPDPENKLRGASEIAIFRRARPGKDLEGLGLMPAKAESDEAPRPPVE